MNESTFDGVNALFPLVLLLLWRMLLGRAARTFIGETRLGPE